MSQAKQLTVRASELQTGDLCRGSGARILRGPQSGARTPSGKVELIVSYRPGQRKLAEWGARTLIQIMRFEGELARLTPDEARRLGLGHEALTSGRRADTLKQASPHPGRNPAE